MLKYTDLRLEIEQLIIVSVEIVLPDVLSGTHRSTAVLFKSSSKIQFSVDVVNDERK